MANEASGGSRARTGVRTWPVERARRARRRICLSDAFARMGGAGSGPPGGCCRGSQSPSAPGSSFISPLSTSPPLGPLRVWQRSAWRRRSCCGAPHRFRACARLFAVTAGFAVATLKAALIAHPVLRYPAYGETLAGFVELREESQKTDRFIVRVDRITGNRIVDVPQRVRLPCAAAKLLRPALTSK